MSDEKPDYRVYRSRPRLFGRGKESSPRDGIDDLRQEIPRPEADRPEYRVHRSGGGGGRRRPRLPGRRIAQGFTIWKALRYLVYAVLGWLLLSGLLFMVSAQLESENVSDEAKAALADSGYPLTSPNTVLVLGSDARTEGLDEPGSRIGGPSRSDSIMLMRVGGGRSARLSIPRDTEVDIPGFGRSKINAAYAYGGAPLAIETIQDYLGIEINHLVEVNFENFPELIDAMGGVDVKTGCVVSKINGGRSNGGTTLRLKRGENHLDGDEALALARTRRNECNPTEDDLTRAKRQQEILGAMRSRLFSPSAFVRLPWVSWKAPQAIRTDMGGAQLLGVFAAMAASGTPKPRVLPLVLSEEQKQAEVERFLDGT